MPYDSMAQPAAGRSLRVLKSRLGRSSAASLRVRRLTRGRVPCAAPPPPCGGRQFRVSASAVLPPSANAQASTREKVRASARRAAIRCRTIPISQGSASRSLRALKARSFGKHASPPLASTREKVRASARRAAASPREGPQLASACASLRKLLPEFRSYVSTASCSLPFVFLQKSHRKLPITVRRF